MVANDTRAIVVQRRSLKETAKKGSTLRVYDLTAKDTGKENEEEMSLTKPMKVLFMITKCSDDTHKAIHIISQ